MNREHRPLADRVSPTRCFEGAKGHRTKVTPDRLNPPEPMPLLRFAYGSIWLPQRHVHID
jgi:hypothetical protein